MLEYDNSAFYYFSITLLAIYLIPGTYYGLAEFLRAFLGSGDVGTKARTTVEQAKANALKKTTTGWGRLNNSAYLTNLFVLAVCWAAFLYLNSLVMNDGEVRTFDPYAILGIEQGATLAQIKKAYRALSLMYHPDKNRGNKKVEEIFIKVGKAYEALTNEESKANYDKYGNPDGKQALEVSIGLPRILLDNPKVVLIVYLVAMVIVIPVAVWLWHANSRQYNENNMKNRTHDILYDILKVSNRVENMPEIMASSDECQTVNLPSTDDKLAIDKLYGKLMNDNLMVAPKTKAYPILNGNLLIHAHVLRLQNFLSEKMRVKLEKMLMNAPEIIGVIITTAYNRNNRNEPKWFDTTLSAIHFEQYVVQGLWITDDPLEQLPHITPAQVKAIKTDKVIKSFADYLRTPDSEKPGLAGLSDVQKQDIFAAAKVFPTIAVATKFVVEADEDSDEPEDIYEKDLVTLKVTMDRTNLTNAADKAAPVYSPRFPRTVLESWWLVLVEKIKKQGKEYLIHSVERVTAQSKIFTSDLKFMAPDQAGSYELELHVLSDCYIGLDIKIPLQLKVLPASELPEYAPHPEDLELDNEPTLFEQMMAANVDEDSSDDEEPGEEPVTKHKTVKDSVSLNKKSVIYEDDDEDD